MGNTTKKNTCASALKAFKDIVTEFGKPLRLNTDRGSELICKNFERYLDENNIKHYLSYSVRKCPIIERFNLTLQNILYRMMAQNRSYKWSEFLPQAMQIYRKRYHRTIKMSPREAELGENEEAVRASLIEFFHR